jgi:hypothetical protein
MHDHRRSEAENRSMVKIHPFVMRRAQGSDVFVNGSNATGSARRLETDRSRYVDDRAPEGSP